ncbi:MAG: hypothetical protein HY660_03065 [Armatimonadetes bacterium]|nr:hypothetical protein [Armatimonadota bacterium]
MPAHVRGKGMWIWQIRRCEGGAPQAIADRARAAGLTHAVVKIADGRSPFNGDLQSHVAALRAAGLKVWGWQYTYGAHPEEEAEAAASRVTSLGLDGFAVDAEVEYKGNPQAARAYMRRLRALLPGHALALSSYYLPDYHPTFPWSDFMERCDFCWPQVYWYSRDPVESLERSMAQNARFGKGILPTGAAYPEAANAAQIRRFLEAARSMGLDGVNFWSWEHARWEMWEVIAGFAWPVPRLIVAVENASGDFDYHPVPGEFTGSQFLVRSADLAAVVGRTSAETGWTPVREALAALGVEAQFVTHHLNDPENPRVYVFVAGS